VTAKITHPPRPLRLLPLRPLHAWPVRRRRRAVLVPEQVRLHEVKFLFRSQGNEILPPAFGYMCLVSSRFYDGYESPALTLADRYF